ncbi:MAG: MYXO-CTERM sorting domain-containing protein [Myxococcaceae bacterium]|nr:MYXO-CTERM sorting domain-containing protein [Myxococcaceae bacterium]
MFEADAGTAALVVMSGEVLSSATAFPAAEVVIGSSGANATWGRAALSGVAPGLPMPWVFFDFTPGGQSRTLPVRLRSAVPGATATLRNFQLGVIRVPAQELRADEVLTPVQVPAAWTTLVTAPPLAAGNWVLIGLATGLDTSDGGIALRLRVADGGVISTSAADGGDRQFALVDGSGWPQLLSFSFFATPASRVVSLEARSFDGAAMRDGGTGPLLTDVRLIALSVSGAATPAALVGAGGAGVGPSPQTVIDTTTSTVAGTAYLLLQGAQTAPLSRATVDVQLEGGGTTTQRAVAGLEAHHLSAGRSAFLWSDGGLLTMRGTASLAAGGTVATWGRLNALLLLTRGAERVRGLGDGGFVLIEPPGDAGAGDAGVPDGGTTPDGGTADAGAVDGGVVNDGGIADGGVSDGDGGTLTDAGLPVPRDQDAGSQSTTEATYEVGCGCQGAPGLFAFLVLLSWRRVSRSARAESTNTRSA